MATSDKVQLLLNAAELGDLHTVQDLIKNGLHPGEQDPETGKSALMLAAKHNRIEILKFLLEKGAPWNAIDKFSKCAGNYAIDSENFQQETVDLLVNHAVKCELLLGQLGKSSQCFVTPGGDQENRKQNNADYINSRIKYTETSLIDQENDGVMMEWERPIMNSHATKLLESLEISEGQTKIRMLNVGFGMGIIDGFLQQGVQQVIAAYAEAGIQLTFEHHVIEAHPGVIKNFHENRKEEFENFTLLEGRWQDVIDNMESTEESKYDLVYFDTYAEYDNDFYQFIQLLPKILKSSGKFSFFNGNCPDNIFFHDRCR